MRSSSRPSTIKQASRPPRRRIDRQALEDRRRQAAALFRRGSSQADVARALKVSRQSASLWHKRWLQGGLPALLKAERAGRPKRLHLPEIKRLEKALLAGARANGFTTELWTLRRVAEVIERLTGVRYHPGHVWRVLRGMGWSRQKPARRAVERDQEKIEAWVRDEWPALKGGPKRGEPGSYSRTKAVSR